MFERVATDDKVIGTGRATLRLRLYFLAPLTAVILAAVGVSIADLFRHQYADIQQGVVRVRASAVELYEDSVRDSAKALRTLMHVLGRDETLRAALARRDRAALLARAAPMFEDLKREYGVTHFYFSGPDRVNLLRVHAPERYGDVIDRFTTLQAERGGAAVHGVELGPLGLFTLRVVVPWREEKTGRLLGYVELGMEIDHVIEHIRRVLGVDLYVLIDKQFLKRKDWEDGMRSLGRTPDWERFPGIVVSLHGGQAIPPALAERLAIVLPETALEAAAKAAERIRSTIEQHPFGIGGGKNIPMTVSIGVAAFPAHADTAEALVGAAEQALYAAKEIERNRACCYEKSGVVALPEPATP